MKNVKIYKSIHRLTILIGLLSILLPIVFWKKIPNRVPTHFGGAGQIDAWGNKGSLILLFFVVIFLLGIMSILEYYLYTSGNSNHANEGEKMYLSTFYPCIVIMDFCLQLAFAYMILCTSLCRNLGILYLPSFLIGCFAPIIYYIMKYRKLKSSINDVNSRYRKTEKNEAGERYRTKINPFINLALLGSMAATIWLFVTSVMEGDPDWILFGTLILTCLIIIPCYRIKYVLYPEHLLVSCSIFGKDRIPYTCITSMKETHNPISSAALSLDRIQIDYSIEGSHGMVLISPVRKKEFMKKIEERRDKVWLS